MMLMFLLLISMQVAEKWNALPVYSVITQENSLFFSIMNNTNIGNIFSIHMGTFPQSHPHGSATALFMEFPKWKWLQNINLNVVQM